MKIGILGTRGIPNHYGGFEQFAQFLSEALVKRGCEVCVYSSHKHPYQKSNWRGVRIIRKFDPEFKIGLAGQFVYDFNCLQDARKRNFDILLQLGYTTNAVFAFLLNKKTKHICNPDGMEWKRSKYPLPIKWFLRFSEKLAVRTNQLLVADSMVIRDYYREKYNADVIYAAYPASVHEHLKPRIIKKFKVEPYEYHLFIARFQSDNNLDLICKAYTDSNSRFPLIAVGNSSGKYGKYLRKKYRDANIRFVGGIYDFESLNNLRYYSNLYFHGHSAGGTNPSLLEAMAASALICAHDNPFNRSVLNDDAYFFKSAESLTKIITEHQIENRKNDFIKNNLKKIREKYAPEKIINIYYGAFKQMLQ